MGRAVAAAHGYAAATWIAPGSRTQAIRPCRQAIEHRLGKPDFRLASWSRGFRAEGVLAAHGRPVDVLAGLRDLSENPRARVVPGAGLAGARSTRLLRAAGRAGLLGIGKPAREGAPNATFAPEIPIRAFGLSLFVLLALRATAIQPAELGLLRRCHLELPSKWRRQRYPSSSTWRKSRDEPRKATGSGPGTKRDGPVNGLRTSGELFDRTYGQLTAGADIYKRELLGAFDEGRSPALGRYLDAEGEADAA